MGRGKMQEEVGVMVKVEEERHLHIHHEHCHRGHEVESEPDLLHGGGVSAALSGHVHLWRRKV